MITLPRPDDWHVHLRNGGAMVSVLPHTARRFSRAAVMPNLKSPVDTVEKALAYRKRILAALPEGMTFDPLMTLYLTPSTPPEEVHLAKAAGILGIKYYPAGVTTHAGAGPPSLAPLTGTLEAMEEAGLPLLIHGEATDPHVDPFDREKAFIDGVLDPLIRRFPRLKVVLEHITTQEAVQFIQEAPERVAATVTAHHLLLNRGALFEGGLRPHHYCLPLLKREQHRLALIEAVTSGHPRFFLGTDSAPHPKKAKESSWGCAGIFTAHAALELYAEVFAEAGALDRLEGFASRFGADFYGLPRNGGTLTLVQEPWRVPEVYPLGDEEVVPLRAGQIIAWRILDAPTA